MRKNKITVRDLCIIGMFAAVISLLSLVIVPLPGGVPMTLQTFAVPLAGVVLGKRKGTMAAIVYVVLGAFGVPVFSGFGGGLGRILGPTGGFIIAYPLMAFYAAKAAGQAKKSFFALWIMLAVAVEYTCGTLQYILVTGSSVKIAIMACFVPFIPTEIIKVVLLSTAGIKCRQVLLKSAIIKNLA